MFVKSSRPNKTRHFFRIRNVEKLGLCLITSLEFDMLSIVKERILSAEFCVHEIDRRTYERLVDKK